MPLHVLLFLCTPLKHLKEPACQCRRHKRCGFDPCQEDPLEEGMATHSNIIDWRTPMDRVAWQATNPQGFKELDTNEIISYACT